jgi:hypothetical protein
MKQQYNELSNFDANQCFSGSLRVHSGPFELGAPKAKTHASDKLLATNTFQKTDISRSLTFAALAPTSIWLASYTVT